MGKLIVNEITSKQIQTSEVKTGSLTSKNTDKKINLLNNITFNGSTLNTGVNSYYYINNIDKQYDSTTRSYINGNFADGMTWNAIENCKPGSYFDISIGIPCRNDTTGWGGLYTDIIYKIPESTVYTDWISMGNSGYEGVMYNGAAAIATYNRRFLLQPSVAPTNSLYSIQFKFRHRSYDGTTTINGSHDINRTGSGGSTYQNSSLEPLEHFWTTIIVIEYAYHPGF